MVDRPEDHRNEIEFIQSVVGKYFPIYQTDVEFDIVKLYVRMFKDKEGEEKFDRLRRELVPMNYIPHLREEEGEQLLLVKKQPERNFKSVKVNLIMLFITLGTTLLAGMWWWSYYDPSGEPFMSLYNLGYGALFFTLPLMSILGVHEMGHYMLARHHNIKASLPFFLPAPPPLGTIGAFISIREPIPDKKSLLDLGIAGPIAGFIVAIPVSILGLYLGMVMGRPLPAEMEGTFMIVNLPLIMRALSLFLPIAEDVVLHPTAFAGWVGFLVTGLNLLPAGQLDGGHVFRSLFGENAKYASYMAAGFLVVVGLWWYPGWLLFALILFFLVGLKHPPPLNELSNLDGKRKIVGALAIVILLTTFHPIPVEQVTYRHDFSMEIDEPPSPSVVLNESLNYTVRIENTGEPSDDVYRISSRLSQNEGWNSDLYLKNETTPEGTNYTDASLAPGEFTEVIFNVWPTRGASESVVLEISAKSNNTGRERVENFTIELGYYFDLSLEDDRWYKLIEDGTAQFTMRIENHGRSDTYDVSTSHISDPDWNVLYTYEDITDENITIELDSGDTAYFHVEIKQLEGLISNEQDVKLIDIEVLVRSRGFGGQETKELIGILLD